MTPGLILPESREGAAELVESLHGDLLPLVDLFKCRSAQIVDHLASRIPTIPADEQGQARRVLEHWRTLATPADLGSALPWWDFRLEAERDAIPVSTELLPADVADAVHQVIQAWGLNNSHGLAGSVDVALVLGGLVTADFTRPAFLGDLIASGSLDIRQVVGLAGNRDLSAWERRYPGAAACTTEAEALTAGFRHAGVADFTMDVAPDVGGVRATTATSVGWWLSQHPHLRASGRLATITSSIYRVRTHLDVLTQTDGCQVVTASLASGVGPWRSQLYLQEIKAAADGLPRLREWAGLRLTPGASAADGEG